MRIPTLAVLLVFAGSGSTVHSQQRPSIVPPGWVQVGSGQPQARSYRSPDGRALLEVGATSKGTSQKRDMDAVAYRSGERITYQRRTGSFIAVSGFRGETIFYRKSNRACGGTRWHHISLDYPATDKTRMDRLVTRIAHGLNNYGDDCAARH